MVTSVVMRSSYVTCYFKAYPCVQTLVMSGKTFNMAEPVFAEGYSNFSNVENGLSMFS